MEGQKSRRALLKIRSQTRRDNTARVLICALYVEAQQRLGHPDALTLSTAGLAAVALGSDADKDAELLSSVIENAPPGSQHGLVGCNNLAMCYERRGWCLQAFHAFRFATDLRLLLGSMHHLEVLELDLPDNPEDELIYYTFNQLYPKEGQ